MQVTTQWARLCRCVYVIPALGTCSGIILLDDMLKEREHKQICCVGDISQVVWKTARWMCGLVPLRKDSCYLGLFLWLGLVPLAGLQVSCPAWLGH